MNIGDRFTKNGKTYEVTAINEWGYGFKKVTDEVFEVTEEVPETTPEVVEEEVPVVKKPRARRTKK